MARLERALLVRAEAHATGSRKSRRYRVTPAGRAALRRWAGPPVPDDIAGVPPDPLRARLAFMTVLPAAVRQTYLEEIEARMEHFLALAEQDPARAAVDDPYFELMTRGAISMQKTRLRWVRDVLRALREGKLP